MHSLREQFVIQCRRASITAKYTGVSLDVVMVFNKGSQTRISILGNAISRAMYENWRRDGARIKLLCIYGPSGEVQPRERNHETNQRNDPPSTQ